MIMRYAPALRLLTPRYYVRVYQPGNNTAGSEVQTIDVTQAQQPATLSGVACTTSQQNDGQITGVGTTMEYRLS